MTDYLAIIQRFKNLAANWIVANWLAVASALFAIANFYALMMTLGEMQIEKRPWVGAPDITMTPNASGKFDFDFKFKNVGKDIAFDISFYVKWSEDNTDLLDWCPRKLHSVNSPPKGFHYSLVPDGTFTWSKPGDNIFTNVDIHKLPFMNPHIIGCIYYDTGPNPTSAEPRQILFDANLVLDREKLDPAYAINPN